MVKITYITRLNFFSEKAHVHTITKTSEALSEISGIGITLVSSDNSLAGTDDRQKFFDLHGVNHEFPVVSLNSLSNKYKNSPNFFLYNLGTFFATLSLLAYVWKNRKEIDVIYFRDHLLLPVVLFGKYFLGKKIVYESHYILSKKFGQYLTEMSVKSSDGVVAIAVALKNYYRKYNKNIIVSFCASSDVEKFKTDLSAADFRKKVGLPPEFFYLVYTGNVDLTGNGDSYGLEDIIRSLPLMPKEVCFVAVGKKTEGEHPLEVLAKSLEVLGRFRCLPWVSREKTVDYILSADILIIPKSGGKPGNSPTKMFEYLAAGRPIVAAETQAIKEVLCDKINASLVDRTIPKAWAEAVSHLRSHPEYAEKITARARKDSGLYTWQVRGEAIGSFIKKIYA